MKATTELEKETGTRMWVGEASLVRLTRDGLQVHSANRLAAASARASVPSETLAIPLPPGVESRDVGDLRMDRSTMTLVTRQGALFYSDLAGGRVERGPSGVRRLVSAKWYRFDEGDR